MGNFKSMSADGHPSPAPTSGPGLLRVGLSVLLVTAVVGLWLVPPTRWFDTAAYPKRWECGSWEDALGWLHIISDSAVFAAYVSIPVVLLVFVRKRRDIPFAPVFMLFGAFILLCGIGHAIEALIFWHPVYPLAGIVKLFTAVVSCMTVVALVRIMPGVMKLPNLVAINTRLESQVAERVRAQEELAIVNEQLKASQADAIELATESNRLRAMAERYLVESRQAEALAKTTVDASPTAQIMIDRDGGIVLFNRMAEKIFGYHRDELLGKPIEILVPQGLRDEHVAHRNSFIKEPLARAMGIGRDLNGVRKDGSEFPVEIGLQPLRIADGPSVLASVIDISARKKVEQSQRRDAEALASSNKELERFAQFASHDLQEPLRKLISFSSLLIEDLGADIPEAAGRDLKYITDAATRMRSLVRALLELSSSSRREMEVQEVDLAACVQEAIETLSLRLQETNTKVEIDPLPAWQGDHTLLTMLFQNLIGNAIKFCPKDRPPAIHVTCEQRDGQTVFGVRDNGIGIEAQYVEDIFNPFRRLHARDDYEGTGIGLAICVKAVERHGGRLWVDSEPGSGSHFLFTLEPGSLHLAPQEDSGQAET